MVLINIDEYPHGKQWEALGKLLCRTPLGLSALLCGQSCIAPCTEAQKLPANTSLELFVTSSQSISALKCKNITVTKAGETQQGVVVAAAQAASPQENIQQWLPDWVCVEKHHLEQ